MPNKTLGASPILSGLSVVGVTPHLHRTVIVRFAIAGLILVLSACRKPDPAETLSSAASELATASLAGDAWVKHRTPSSFTGNTLRDSRMQLADQQKILFSEAVPPVDTAKLRATLDHAKSVMATMEKLIAQQNYKLFPGVLALLEQDAKDVKDMSNSQDPGS